MIESHPNQKRGIAYSRKLRRLELDDVRILLGHRQTLDIDSCAANHLDQRLQIR
jgi:hypothetical protein